MKKLLSLVLILFFFNSSYCQEVKELRERVEILEMKVKTLEKAIFELQKVGGAVINNKITFEIKYEVESEDKITDFLITYWDKDGKSTSGWFKSGWKYIFSTSDINQQILLQAKPGEIPKKTVTVRVYVNNKLVKSDTKSIFKQMDGPSCQVILSDL